MDQTRGQQKWQQVFWQKRGFLKGLLFNQDDFMNSMQEGVLSKAHFILFSLEVTHG